MFALVRAQAKVEAPLKSLAGGGGAALISTIADVTFYGKDQTGNDVAVTGSISVNFADWGDPPESSGGGSGDSGGERETIAMASSVDTPLRSCFAAAVIGACTTKKVEPPAPSGPSELAHVVEPVGHARRALAGREEHVADQCLRA